MMMALLQKAIGNYERMQRKRQEVPGVYRLNARGERVYLPNGKREVARRVRQMEMGKGI